MDFDFMAQPPPFDDDAVRRAERERDARARYERLLASDIPLSADEMLMVRSADGTDGRLYEQTPAVRLVGQWYREDVEARKRRVLLLCGPVGTGKTFAAALCAYRHGEPTQYVCSPALDMSTARQVSHCGMLILDDLGTEEITPRWKEALFFLIERRKHRPTVITTNLAPAGIKQRYDARVVDRLRSCARVSMVTGKSLRQTVDSAWD